MPATAISKGAPAFELFDLKGERYRLQEGLARGPLLIAFFKVACPTCQYAFPFVERIHRQFVDPGAQVWGISQDDVESSRGFAERYGVTFPILIDEPPYAASRAYGVRFTPTLFLVDSNGHISLSSDGFSKSDLIEIQKRLAQHYSQTVPPLFRADEKVPEYKPG